MSLVQASLKSDIEAAYNNAFAKSSTSDETNAAQQALAQELSTAVHSYVSAGVVNTADTCTAPPGTGVGVGAIVCQQPQLRADILSALLQCYANQQGDGFDTFAKLLAVAIHSYVSAGIVQTTDTCTVLMGTAMTTVVASGQGSILCQLPPMQSAFVSAFSSCYQTEQGNPLSNLAQQLSTAIHSYMTSGVINTTLVGAVTGIGVGAIT